MHVWYVDHYSKPESHFFTLLMNILGYMITPGYTPDNYCQEEGIYGGWTQDPKELTCQKNYCTLPRPENEGIWFFGCTDEESQKMGIITEGGSCELRCMPGYQRITPQLIICMNGIWHQLKASTGAYTEKTVNKDDIGCLLIPTDKLSDFERKKMELFKPPEQLGTEEENTVTTTLAPTTDAPQKPEVNMLKNIFVLTKSLLGTRYTGIA